MGDCIRGAANKSAVIAGHSKSKPALYLTDHNQPLVVVGNTKIQGEVWLPKKGIKTGSMGGKSYYGNQLVYGIQRKSEASITPFPSFTSYTTLTELVLNAEEDQFKDLSEHANLIQPFHMPTAIYAGDSHISLRDVQLTGNIIVQASQKITVYNSAILQDIILLAPEIEIMSGVKGNFQAFATRKIKVNKSCVLQYPSALVLDTNKSMKKDPKNPFQIRLEDMTVVKGIIAYLDKSTKNNQFAQVYIAEKAEVYGEVYSQKNIELKGTVYGSVYTNGFIAQEFGSTYINHIYNGQILANDLAASYAGLVHENSELKVAKWLYY